MATRTPKQTSKRSATAKPKPKPKPKPKAKRATAAKKKPPAKRRASGPDLYHVLATLPRALDAEGVAQLRAAVRRHRGPVRLIPEPDAYGEAKLHSWDRQLIDATLVEVLLEENATFVMPSGPPESYVFWLYHWEQRDDARRVPHDDLSRVIAHPYFGKVLFQSFLPTRETKSNAGVWLDRAARYDSFAPVFEALGAKVREMCAAWTLGALDVHGSWLESLIRPAILRRAPAIAEAVRGLESWKLLREQLRAGSMDEWGWPAQDEAVTRLGAAPARMTTSGPAPTAVYHDPETKRVVAFDGTAVVFDEPFESPFTDIRGWFYVDGDVLALSYPTRAIWVKSGIELDADAYGFFEIGTVDGTPIAKSLQAIQRGATTIGTSTHCAEAWFDGAAYYATSYHAKHLRADGMDEDERGLWVFDPATGARREASLPAWFASRLTSPDARLYVDRGASHMMAVAASSTASPLGAKDGIGAAALYRRDHALWVEGIDGRKASGTVNGQHAVALMTFPERDGFYPVIGSNPGIALPDGTTPLVPIERLLSSPYWGGGPPVPLAHWYSLRPRDPRGSRALARCSDEAAKALVAASAAPTNTRDTPAVVMDFGDLHAVLEAPPVPADIDAVRRAAIGRAVPEVTHPKLLDGIAQLAAHAVRTEQVIARMRSRLASALAPSVVESTFANKDAASFATLVGHGMHGWVEQLGTQLGQQMLDVARYLFDDATDEPRTPASTVFPWDQLLPRIGEVIYRALACATPKQRREQLVRLIEQWRATGLPAHLPQLRLVTMTLPVSDALSGLGRETPHRLATWTNRYFLRHRGSADDLVTVLAIEATRDGVFRLPPGATLVEEHAIDRRFDSAALDRTLVLARERVRVEYAPALVDLISAQTGLSRPAAAIAWGAGYAPWLLGDKARDRMQITRAELDSADLELRGKRLHEVYAHAMPADPAAMFEAEGAQAFAAAWIAMFGRRD